MPVETSTSRVQYATNGTTGPWSIPFYFLADADVRVIYATAAGVETELALTTNYSLTGAGVPAGGSCTTVTAYAAGGTITILRGIEVLQPSDYTDGDPLPAATLERNLDRLTMIDQETREIIGRCLIFPASESAAVELPSAASRANTTMGFDANGDPTVLTPVSGSAADVLTRLADYTDPDEGAALVGLDDTLAYATSAPRSVGAKLAETISLRRDLAVGDGSADDTPGFAALVAAVNASTARTVEVIIPPGDYRVASATIAASPLTWTRSRVTVRGRGKPRITVTGTTVTNWLFGSTGQSDIAYKGLHLVGNNQADDFANGAAVIFCNSSTADIEGFTVEDCHFDNFKGDYWIYLECLGTKAMRDIRIRRNRFDSRTGNSRSPASVAVNSGFVGIIGNSANSTSYIDDVWVTDNAMRGSYIKSGVMVYNNVYNFHVQRNNILDCGLLEVSDDAGAYAILVYSQGPNVGSDGDVTHNRIRSPRSCGIYHANSFPRTVYAHNIISGQTDTVTGTLPKGGIVINGGVEVSVTGGSITDCAASGVFWSQNSSATTDALVAIDGGGLRIARCGTAVTVESSQQNSGNVAIRNIAMSENSTGVLINLIASATLTGLTLSNLTISSTVAGSYGVRVLSDDASFKITKLVIEGGSIDTVTYGIIAGSITAGSVTIKGVSFIGNFADSAVNISGSTKVCLLSNSFEDFTAGGFCLKSAGAQGTIDGQVFRNVDSALLIENSGSEDLGLDTPTWTGTLGQRVQFMSCGDTSIGGINSVLQGWVYTTAWRVQHLIRA